MATKARKSAKSDCALGCKIQAKEVGIYYFDKENRAEFLELDADAQFHTWPEDFMEQVEKDLYYLRKMRLANGHRDVVK